jgi:hypothetical protein
MKANTYLLVRYNKDTDHYPDKNTLNICLMLKKKRDISLVKIFINEDHIGKKLDIIEFVKYDWKKVVVMNLNDCKLNSNDWKVFCSHHYLFQNLKILSISIFVSHKLSIKLYS